MSKKIRIKRVAIKRTKHKTQPFKVIETGRIDKERKERYVTLFTACRGAVRGCRDFLAGGTYGVYENYVHMTLPDGSTRKGYIHSNGTIVLTPIIKGKKK